MKGTPFYQVRQGDALSLLELTALINQALIALYPGTSLDETLTPLYGAEDSFFISRADRTECIWVCISPEPLSAETLGPILKRAAEAEFRAREFRSSMEQERKRGEFLVSVFAAQIPEDLRKALGDCGPHWSFFEYMLLQSETDEGIALKKIEIVSPPVPLQRGIPIPPSSGRDTRLSPEELNALIDLSLGLELRSRGLPWEGPVNGRDIDA